jgi:hypothetical protein
MSTSKTIDAVTFQTLLQTYGGELRRWPADLREVAAVQMALHPEWLGEALRVDSLLDSYTLMPMANKPALLEQTMRSSTVANDNRVMVSRYRLAMLAACGVFGFWLGLNTSSITTMPQTISTTTLSTLTFGTTHYQGILL